MSRFLSILVLSSSLVACFVENQRDNDDNPSKSGKMSGSNGETSASSGDKITTEVSDEGATLELGEAKLEVPEGALDKEIEISIKVVEPPVPIPDEYKQASMVYECTPHGLEFEKPVNFDIGYTNEPDETFVVLRMSDDEDDSWEIEDASSFKSSVAALELEHFSFFTVVYKVQRALSKPEAGIRDAGVADSDSFINSLDSDASDGSDQVFVIAGSGGNQETGGTDDESGSGGGSSGAGGSGGSGGGDEQATGCLGLTIPDVTDYSENGPFPTVSVNNTGPDGSYTIFKPQTLGENGFSKHPIATWGNGITTTPTMYSELLSVVASHGFVVVASNSTSVTAALMTNGLDWLVAQNSTPGEFEGKLATECAVSIGYSLGGGAAVSAGSHSAVVATISFHGLQGSAEALHGPLLLFTSTTDTFVTKESFVQPCYDRSSTVPTWLATLNLPDDTSGHTYIIGDAGEERAPAIAWLRLWVYGDAGARIYFYGNDCILCKDPWTDPQRKNNDW